MTKKKPTKAQHKKECDCCHCKEFAPKFYYMGDGNKDDQEWLCNMALKGITVIAYSGKPGCPNPNGCK